MALRRAAIPFLVLGTVALAACGAGTADHVATTSTVSTAPVAGSARQPTVDVHDQTLLDYATSDDGQPFRLSAARGSLLLVYFGYLSCPDVCPLTMVDTANGIRALGAAAADVEVAMITVDLERDLGVNIRSYLTHFFPDGRFHALRARDDNVLRNVAYRFGASYRIEPHQPGTYYGVAHTGSTYVVDERGQLVWEWPFGTPATDITSTLRALLDRRS